MGNGELGMGNDSGGGDVGRAAPSRHSPFHTPHSPFHRIRMFLELVRFSHTIFALPFALLSAAMAWHVVATWLWTHDEGSWAPQTRGDLDRVLYGKIAIDLLGILLCMIFARSAAMAFNRVVDARFDADNPRTAKRHIPAGLVSRSTVALWTAICGAGFIASTLLFLPNRWPLYLSVPFLVFICAYSLMKRFTSLAHFWLGASLMLAPIAAWIAILGDDAFRMPWPPLVLGGAVLLWVAGFDIIYATQDVDVDRKLRLRSVPARFGVSGALRIAAACHLGMLALLFALPSVFPAFGTLWYVGAAAVAALLVYEHSIVKPDDLTRINAAFFNCNAIVSLGLLVVGIVDLLV